MARFTLPRDLYHGKGALEALKSLKGERAMVCTGGGSMKRFEYLDLHSCLLEVVAYAVKETELLHRSAAGANHCALTL